LSDSTESAPKSKSDNGATFAAVRASDLVRWAQANALVGYPVGHACCTGEFESAQSPRFGIEQLGLELGVPSPRDADVLWVVGSVSHKFAPELRRTYEQMADPKWVIAFGACAASGGLFDNYACVGAVDRLIPCDVYVPGCPPRPEAALAAVQLLMEKIRSGERRPRTVGQAPVDLVPLGLGRKANG
jgi:NADH-quinone oxidoreductase subunit B